MASVSCRCQGNRIFRVKTPPLRALPAVVPAVRRGLLHHFNPTRHRPNPSSQRFDPTRQRFDPTRQRLNPSRQRFNPSRHTFTPIRHRFNPPRQHFTPSRYRLNPTRHQLNPFRQRFNTPRQRRTPPRPPLAPVWRCTAGALAQPERSSPSPSERGPGGEANAEGEHSQKITSPTSPHSPTRVNAPNPTPPPI